MFAKDAKTWVSKATFEELTGPYLREYKATETERKKLIDEFYELTKEYYDVTGLCRFDYFGHPLAGIGEDYYVIECLRPMFETSDDKRVLLGPDEIQDLRQIHPGTPHIELAKIREQIKWMKDNPPIPREEPKREYIRFDEPHPPREPETGIPGDLWIAVVLGLIAIGTLAYIVGTPS